MRVVCFLLALSGAAISFGPPTAEAQSAMPAFSDPYGGISTSAGPTPPDATLRKPAAQQKQARRSRPHAKRVTDAAKLDHTPAVAIRDLDKELALPSAASSPVAPRNSSTSASTDRGLGFNLKWSAENDPHFDTATSTVPAIDEIKRNMNETPAENGSTIEGGLNLKF